MLQTGNQVRLETLSIETKSKEMKGPGFGRGEN